MKAQILVIAALSILALAACDQGKPRRVPIDDMTLTPPGAAAQPVASLSVGLPRRPELAEFSLDRIGAAADPLSRKPVITGANQPVVVQGFAFDPVAKTPAKGVDVVIDGKVYGTTYGAERADVAGYFRRPSLTAVGFATMIPQGVLLAGPHVLIVRVVAADAKSYFQSPGVGFEIK